MFKCSNFVQIQGRTENITEKNISDGKEMSENTNGTKSKTEFASVEDPLVTHITVSNEKNIVSEISNTINAENVIFAPGEGQNHDFREEQARFLIFILKVNLAIM